MKVSHTLLASLSSLIGDNSEGKKHDNIHANDPQKIKESSKQAFKLLHP